MRHERPDVVAVALTGGIGAGKTTALRFFAEAGARTLSADGVVHRLYEREDLKQTLAAHFGPGILDADGSVDRRKLAEAVRGHPDRLRWLESLTHPLVGEEIWSFVGSTPPGGVVVCEVPLLFEAGLERCFDLIVTVEAGAEQRRERSTHGFGLELFGELESLQASSERRVEGSDLVFVNDGGIEKLRAFVQETYCRARLLAGSSAGPASEKELQ